MVYLGLTPIKFPLHEPLWHPAKAFLPSCCLTLWAICLWNKSPKAYLFLTPTSIHVLPIDSRKCPISDHKTCNSLRATPSGWGIVTTSDIFWSISTAWKTVCRCPSEVQILASQASRPGASVTSFSSETYPKGATLWHRLFRRMIEWTVPLVEKSIEDPPVRQQQSFEPSTAGNFSSHRKLTLPVYRTMLCLVNNMERRPLCSSLFSACWMRCLLPR